MILQLGEWEARDAERRAAARGRAAARRGRRRSSSRPDRLVVVKGGPAARRAYFDRVLGRLRRRGARCRPNTARRSAQRNAALRRVAQRHLVARRARALDRAGRRARGRARGGPPRCGRRARSRPSPSAPSELGLPQAELRYEGEPPTAAELEDRARPRPRPRRDGPRAAPRRLGVLAGDRDLRTFGSQGEQRLAVLSLLLAEAELLARARRGTRPLLLLDDVLSELDPDRRRVLAERLRLAVGRRWSRARASGRAARRADAAARGGSARGRHERGAGGVMERIGAERRARAPPLRRRGGDGGHRRRRGRSAVGETVAANAWPARLARDGTLHVNAGSSTWAFELAAARGGDRRTASRRARQGCAGATALRAGSASGARRGGSHRVARRSLRSRHSSRRRTAHDLAAPIASEELRKSVEKAARCSLAAAADDRWVW